MTIDQIREIVISPDAIMRKEWGKVLLNEIDHLTKENKKLKEELTIRGINLDFLNWLMGD